MQTADLVSKQDQNPACLLQESPQRQSWSAFELHLIAKPFFTGKTPIHLMPFKL